MILRFFKRLFIAAISIAYVGVLALCSLSGPVSADGVTGTSFIGIPKVTFAAGTYGVDESSLTMTLQNGETQLLNDFTMLTSADFSGSSCVDEIFNWASEHPNVAVKYTVSLPNGQTVDNNVNSLDFSGIDSQTLIACCQQLKYLPNVQSVELGVDNDGELLSAQALAALSEACPNASVSYSFQLLGQNLNFESEAVDLTGISSEELDTALTILSNTPNMAQITLGSAVDGSCTLSWDEIARIAASCPKAKLDYSFELYGQTVSFETESLDFSYVEIPDGGAAIKQALPYMSKCTYVDMDSCGLSHEEMVAIRDSAPHAKVVWRVWFGTNYSVRTDAEKILASKPSVGGMIYNDSASALQYCTDMRYLDLGHNTDLSDLSFAASMPKLEVLIIAMTSITDISPLANCPELEYLEINSTPVNSVEALKNSTKLRHLNIADCPGIYDISSLYGLTELERFWIGRETPIPDDQIAAMRAAAPNCTVNSTTDDPHGEAWRFSKFDPNIPLYYWVPRHELLREQMGYNYQEYSFYWLDDKCRVEAPAKYKGMFGKEVYGY